MNTVGIKTTRDFAYPKRIWLPPWLQRLLWEPQHADVEGAVSEVALVVDSEVASAEGAPEEEEHQEAGDQYTTIVPYDSALRCFDTGT